VIEAFSKVSSSPSTPWLYACAAQSSGHYLYVAIADLKSALYHILKW
jgi:hypothetical protein